MAGQCYGAGRPSRHPQHDERAPMTTSAAGARLSRGRVATRVGAIAPAYRRRVLWALMLPAVICELAVYVVPIVAGIYTSFLQVNQFTIRDWFRAPFVGLKNYINVLATP